jgi:DNA-binding MarR family transcriptional regulator
MEPSTIIRHVSVGSAEHTDVREPEARGSRGDGDLPRPHTAGAGLLSGQLDLAVGPAGEAWLLMRELFIAQRPRLNAITAELGLSPPQALALHHLDPDRPLTMGELAGGLCYDNSNVTGIVDRLEERGYVERRPDPRDRRAKLVRITAAGVRTRRDLLARMADPPPPLAELDPDAQVALRDLLRQALEREEDPAR